MRLSVSYSCLFLSMISLVEEVIENQALLGARSGVPEGIQLRVN